MKRLTDTAAAAALCAMCAVFAYNGAEIAVAAVLLTFAAALFTVYFDMRWAALAVNTVYALACFECPELCAGLPAAVYGMAAAGQKLPLAISAAALMMRFANSEFSGAVFCAVCTGMAVLISARTSALEKCSRKLIETRDNSAELNIILAEKNRALALSQDREVYMATLKERNRIAREIHDSVGHMLTRSILQMGALTVLTPEGEQKEHLKQIQQTLDGAMTSMRKSVHDLRDESVDLEQMVRSAADAAAERFRISLDYDMGSDAPTEVKLAFAAIVKEALTNAARYSDGDEVRISVQEYPAFYRVMVRDNGANPVRRDIEPTAGAAGMGLSNMADRARGLGGSINISSDEKGFRIFAAVPKSGREAGKYGQA